MPSLLERNPAEFVRILYLGDSGAGKTGSLISLVSAGYKLRILDLDNGLDALANFLKHQHPDKLSMVEYETVRDKYKATNTGSKVVGTPRAYIKANSLLDQWSDGSKPEEWGEDTVLVIDSLTHLGRAAFAWARALDPNNRDVRQLYKVAQDSLMDVLATITGDSFATNVIVITHIDYRQNAQGFIKGLASSVGSAIAPKIPSFFNTVIAAESVIRGKTAHRTIKTLATTQLDLKNPAPMAIEAEYPLETGLATIFEKLKKF